MNSRNVYQKTELQKENLCIHTILIQKGWNQIIIIIRWIPDMDMKKEIPSDEGKIYRILNVEKQLTYVPEVSPNKFCKPNAVIKRYRTVENPITECESSKYFTGFEKVFPNPLTNLSIFFKKKETIPPRIETKIRTTMVSEIVDRKEVGNDAYKNFIDTHEIDEEIPIHFTKLSKKQIEKNDPRILRVADVITVAQIKKVTPEQLRNRF
ncbi:unnamed protein product [Lepeophtheirus salmonis]|uniref:(salmon louse) hypothetical protein n=1 Tax=Lepeophtheirus salmonis TaxID=72036 RepID=A0A817FA48_LEPSM|nr:unnamed protein product [Lepeophtheirus salmonis]CAG9474888.1 unnamed protein product [Lepeophtheirus salmonis]